jgi:hypothetical protein
MNRKKEIKQEIKNLRGELQGLKTQLIPNNNKQVIKRLESIIYELDNQAKLSDFSEGRLNAFSFSLKLIKAL